jgi:uncharacterized membrane protein YgcG
LPVGAAHASALSAARPQFKTLLACMLRHKDYHEPLFDALQMDVEGTQQKMEGEGGGGSGSGASGVRGGGGAGGGSSSSGKGQ